MSKDSKKQSATKECPKEAMIVRSKGDIDGEIVKCCLPLGHMRRHVYLVEP